MCLGVCLELELTTPIHPPPPQPHPLHTPTQPQVKIPKSLSSEEKKLVESLKELQSAKPAAGAGRGWF